MFGLSLLDLVEVGAFIWVVDKFGNRKKVKVRSEAHRQQLLAQNRKMRAQLAAKKAQSKPWVTKKRVVRRKKKSDWDF